MNLPFDSDPTGKNLFVIPVGGFGFLKAGLKETATGNRVALDADWASAFTLSVTDPDGADVSSWATNTIDPNDSTDDFDADRSSYIGDEITPEQVGLHATVDGSGLPIRLALKIKPPTGAEVTSSSSSRNYAVTFGLKRNGVVVSFSESFNVGPASIPVFSDIVASWSDVDITGASSITDTTQQDAFITQAANEVYGWITGCGLDPDSLPSGADTRPIKTAVIQVTRDAVSGVDLGFAQATKSIREEPRSIVYSTKGDQLSQYERAKQTVEMWCRRYRAFRNVRSAIARQRPADGLHGHDDP